MLFLLTGPELLSWLLKSQILFSSQELSQLQTVAGNTNIVLSMDNNRELNMDGVVEEVRQEYEAIAQKSKAEVDAMYRGRVSRHHLGREASPCLAWGSLAQKPKILFSSCCTSVPGPSEHVGKSTGATKE